MLLGQAGKDLYFAFFAQKGYALLFVFFKNVWAQLMLAPSSRLAPGQQHPRSVGPPLGWMSQQQPVLGSALR